jgi:hypothetical protein
MSADVIKFPAAAKTLTAEERLEALLMASRNRSVIAEFPNLDRGVHTLLEVNAELLTRIAT